MFVSIIQKRIMTTNISLYKKMYNGNKYFYYTWKCSRHYTRRCITTINVSLIHENVYLIIQ